MLQALNSQFHASLVEQINLNIHILKVSSNKSLNKYKNLHLFLANCAKYLLLAVILINNGTIFGTQWANKDIYRTTTYLKIYIRLVKQFHNDFISCQHLHSSHFYYYYYYYCRGKNRNIKDENNSFIMLISQYDRIIPSF
jgi:hypothetical protein